MTEEEVKEMEEFEKKWEKVLEEHGPFSMEALKLAQERLAQCMPKKE